MNGVAKITSVILETHGTGFRIWCDGAFSRLVFALDGVTRVKRAGTGGPCWDVTLDPRFEAVDIASAIYDLTKLAEANSGIGRWVQ